MDDFCLLLYMYMYTIIEVAESTDNYKLQSVLWFVRVWTGLIRRNHKPRYTGTC